MNVQKPGLIYFVDMLWSAQQLNPFVIYANNSNENCKLISIYALYCQIINLEVNVKQLKNDCT